MTHKRLMRELGTGELAYWRAVFERENARFKRTQRQAEREAEQAHGPNKRRR